MGGKEYSNSCDMETSLWHLSSYMFRVSVRPSPYFRTSGYYWKYASTPLHHPPWWRHIRKNVLGRKLPNSSLYMGSGIWKNSELSPYVYALGLGLIPSSGIYISSGTRKNSGLLLIYRGTYKNFELFLYIQSVGLGKISSSFFIERLWVSRHVCSGTWKDFGLIPLKSPKF